MKNIFLLYGPPACGKTTAIKHLKRAVSYISVGQITRSEIKKNTETGKQLTHFLENNTPYSADLISELILNKVKKTRADNNIILDGFPKYKKEVIYFFREIEKNKNTVVKKIVFINVNYSTIKQRVKYRRICTNCLRQYDIQETKSLICINCKASLTYRKDDSPKKLRARFLDYKKSEREILSILKRFKLKIPVVLIDGTKTKADIVKTLEKKIN